MHLRPKPSTRLHLRNRVTDLLSEQLSLLRAKFSPKLTTNDASYTLSLILLPRDQGPRRVSKLCAAEVDGPRRAILKRDFEYVTVDVLG